RSYYPNADLRRRDTVPDAPAALATTGVGLNLLALPAPITYRDDERNLPAAVIELVAPDRSIGTWLVSAHPLMVPQHFEYGGRSWKIALRFTRAYYPFALTLQKFSHDVYAGTDIPKNFSARVQIATPGGRDDRDVLIYMNNPLRYAGLTFYQASFEKGNDHLTILQVVRNPSWLMPYIACAMMAGGLLIQFLIHLVAFARRRRALEPAAA